MFTNSTLVGHRAISTIVGSVLFLALMIGGFSALLSFITLEYDFANAGEKAISREIEILHHDFEIKAVCTDPKNNRLFVEINNLGTQHLEMADIILTNKTISTKPATRCRESPRPVCRSSSPGPRRTSPSHRCPGSPP